MRGEKRTKFAPMETKNVLTEHEGPSGESLTTATQPSPDAAAVPVGTENIGGGDSSADCTFDQRGYRHGGIND